MIDKTVIRSYELKTEIKWDEKEGQYMRKMHRVNDGFSPYELLGILEEAQQDILDQIKDKVKPDVIKREVVDND